MYILMFYVNQISEEINFCKCFYFLGGCDRQCLIDDECHKNDNVPKFRDSGDFVRIDSEGRIIYIGRKDRQVKRNGCRLHLGEIEKVIWKMKIIILA